jgi:Holliday junction resolvase
MALTGQTKYENELKDLLTERGLWVVRSAGSLGDADLVIVDGAVVEVKAIGACSRACSAGGPCAGTEEFRPSKQKDGIEQYGTLRRREEEGYRPFYGIRKKGKNGGWRFAPPSKFTLTRQGMPVLKWKDGAPLDVFAPGRTD